MQDFEASRLGDERIEAVGPVALHLADRDEGERVLFQSPEAGFILLEGGRGGGLIQLPHPSLFGVEQDHAVQRVQRWSVEVYGHQRLVRTRVDNLVEGAVRLGQYASSPDPQSGSLAKLFSLCIKRVFHVFDLSLDAQNIAPESFVVVDGALHTRRPMQHDHLERIEQQDVSGIVVGHALDGGNAPRQVEFGRVDGTNQISQPLEVKAFGCGRSDGLEEGAHVRLGFCSKISGDRGPLQRNRMKNTGMKPSANPRSIGRRFQLVCPCPTDAL